MFRRYLWLVATGFTTLFCSHATAADPWKPAAGPLMTRWAKDVSPDKVHPEYPRPQMVRENWTNLNGLWGYAIRPAAETKQPTKYDGTILVPFPIESALSGVMQRVGPDQKLWYSRGLDARKPGDGGRVLLHFGAVDWQCEVFVNSQFVGKHTGGYDPFTFDITEALTTGKQLQDLTVAVSDPTDANWQPRGKQVNQPKGIWYTPTTGIWQTVWLEVVPRTYIQSIQVVPDLDAKQVLITATVINPQPGVVVFAEASLERKDLRFRSRFKGDASKVTLEIGTILPWTPESPTLYDLKVWLATTAEQPKTDEVASYFAMRKISLGPAEHGVTRMMLNEPLFQYGPLDQGFWPDGLYTAPTDEALKYDLDVTKQLGFNMVRKHVKVEPARWYYHCDKMGLLVWQDMPSGDKHAPWDPVGTHNGKEIERSKESVENFKTEWREIMTDLAHFPCIVVWVPFNEAWGQFDTVGITKFTQELDPTRLVNCASGGNDFPVGHISDLHRYPGPTIPKLEESRAAVLGEYGGLGLPLEGHTWQAKDNWGYRSYKTREELNSAYEQLLFKLRPLIGQGLSAGIYTQTTDVEVEVNGFMTYDREVLKFDAERVAELHRKLYLPPPQEIVVVADSREQPQTWRYVTDKPADGWEKADFDDASWKEGESGFGEPTTPGSKVRTEWKSADIWLRRTIELPKDKPDDLALSIHHDEDTEIYLNGKRIAEVKGYSTDYTLVPLDAKTIAAALKDGENTLAVHCHQTGGGQYIDVGIVRLEEAEQKQN